MTKRKDPHAVEEDPEKLKKMHKSYVQDKEYKEMAKQFKVAIDSKNFEIEK